MGCTLAPPGEYDGTVRVQRWCGLMSNYFDHSRWRCCVTTPRSVQAVWTKSGPNLADSDVLSPVITAMMNCSFTTAIFPACQKHAIVKPLLKKPSFDPFDMKSYRPVSNLTFIGKFLECFAVKRFHEHASAHCLFPVHQSAYRPRHSTEIAVVNFLGWRLPCGRLRQSLHAHVTGFKHCIWHGGPLDSADSAEGQIWRPGTRVRLVHVIPDWSYSKCRHINWVVRADWTYLWSSTRISPWSGQVHRICRGPPRYH